MCGIAGAYLLDDSLKVNLDNMLDAMLDAIEHRGGDATGFVALGESGVTEWQRAACSADDFTKYRRPVPKGTRTFLAHTRWATQGLPAFIENNHPIRRGSFYAIHNGHINNDRKLFELAGREPYGRVDSEAVPARLASLGKLDALGIVMSEIDGAAAIAAVDEKHPSDLAVARGYQSPVYVLRTKKVVIFASTYSAVEAGYTAGIGKLPKRAKIEAMAQGTLFLWKSGTFKKVTFKHYDPPKVKYTYTPAFKEINGEAPKELPSLTGWENDDDEIMECDACGESSSWIDMSYRKDHETELTWQFCESCAHAYDYGSQEWSVYDDLQRANLAILGEDDSE